MTIVKTEIEEAIKHLSLTEEDISLVKDNKELYLELLHCFLKSGDRKWWWEDFEQEAFYFKSYEFPFQEIKNIIPSNTKRIWLMVEDDQNDVYPIYNCKPSILEDLIGECSAFEYYVIDINKQWLLCENHSGQLIGLGEVLKQLNIEKLK